MPLLIDYKACDIQIPKTGTSTRLDLVSQHNLEIAWFGSRHQYKRSALDILHYTFVRNPLTIMQSRYRSLRTLPGIGRLDSAKTFQQCIEDYLNKTPGRLSLEFERAAGCADRVERLEDWPKGLIECWGEAGLDLDLELLKNFNRSNAWASRPQDPRHYDFDTDVTYAEGQIERLKEAEDWIFQRWYADAED